MSYDNIISQMRSESRHMLDRATVTRAQRLVAAALLSDAADVLEKQAQLIDRLADECKAWMNGVADVVEALGYDRHAACGPSDLLPGLTELPEGKHWGRGVMIPLDTGKPERTPGDFERNGQGQPLVKHPETGRKTPYDRPSKWFDDYTGIDPIYANRGTWVHRLTEHIDNGVAWSADLEFVAAGVGLGIAADIQHDIARAWQRFLADHGLTVVHNEANVVNDALRVAGTLDRVVGWQERHVVLDIKTGSKVAKTSYAVQLARYAASLPYDVDTDERGTWTAAVSQTIGTVAHLPLNDILKGASGVQFHLVAVDLTDAHDLARTLHDLKHADLSPAFTIAPPSPSPEVEAPAGGDATHGNAASSPATLDEARARYKALSEGDKAAVGRYWEANETDLTDAAQIMESIDAIVGFHDVTAEAPTRPVAPPKPGALPVIDIEGDMLSEADVAAAGKRYGNIPDASRSWVTVTGARVRLSPAHGGIPSVRRFEILRGLCALAECGFDNDDTVLAIAHHILGDIVWQGAPAAAVVAALDLDEAARFARMCDAFTGAADVSLRFTDDGRAVIEPSVLGVAA